MKDSRLKVIGEFPNRSQIVFGQHAFEKVIVRKEYYVKGELQTEIVNLENGYETILVKKERFE